MKEILGEGGFGVVYKCTDKITGTVYAIKMINKKICNFRSN